LTVNHWVAIENKHLGAGCFPFIPTRSLLNACCKLLFCSVLKKREINMKLGYTIIYVPNVEASLQFFVRAFGMQQKFLHESGDYGELNTGETTLSFASHELGAMNFVHGYVRANESVKPLGVEIALVTDDVRKAHASAIACGASEIAAPKDKPWGQTVSYVRTPDGMLLELCTAMGT
jgi:lactoylglutathione lyase